MTLAILAFLAGVLTILSPCILPVLPFVFAKADEPFARGPLPLLLGMGVTFAGIATLVAVGGSWAVRLNEVGRWLALLLLGFFGVALLSRRVAGWLSSPFVSLGNRMLQSGAARERGLAARSLVLGVATGLLWAPCAGPILGLILTGAAISGANAQTTLLLFAYASGAISSLALATLAGRRVFAALRRSLGAGEWVRRGLGLAVVAAVAAIALGWDTGLLTRLSVGSTNRFEQALLEALPGAEARAAALGGATGPRIEGELPSLDGATAWLNSPALSAAGLRGKVVVIDFWTYSCINCLRTLPYVNAWYDAYRDHGLVVVGVHAPEFAFEKQEANVRRAVDRFGIRYPVAIDNDLVIWRAFRNRYWPAHYFVDAQGRIRGHRFGEGDYAGSERLIRALLLEAGQGDLPPMRERRPGEGVQAAADQSRNESPETYVGYGRARNFSSPGGARRNETGTYEIPASLALNQWALGGEWTVQREQASSSAAPGRIAFRFQARDLHLVLGPGDGGRPVRFKVTLDGRAPGEDRGSDVDEHGYGTVREQRLYQLIRQDGAVEPRTFTIEFLDPGVHAYAFTFG
jgi:cytochrome c biogenesis protein CcdA/thiol-disulfide isomerase/thioredoxin